MVSAEPMRVVGLGKKTRKTAQGSSAITQQIRAPRARWCRGATWGARRRRGGGKRPDTPALAETGDERGTMVQQQSKVGGTSGGAAICKQTATSPQPRGGFVARRLGAAVGTLGDEVATSKEEVRDGHGRGGYTPRCRPGRTTITTRGGAGLFQKEGIKEVRTQKAPSTTRKPTPRKSEGL